jgi:uncharacterized protein (DUF2236 family)
MATIISVMHTRRADALLGFYGPGTMMWRLNREAVLLGAGPAALLLQIAHPLVAEGVAQHSRFESDPFGRLRGTIATTMDLVFGDGNGAESAVRRLNGVHATVRGEVHDEAARRLAESYRALDPELLLWVQATLIVTSVRAYRRWVGPVSAAEAERFWQEARDVGVRLGISRSLSPNDWPALASYWRRMLAADGPVHVTPTALRMSQLIVRPPLPHVPAPLIDLVALPGLALLPARLRQEFGIGWDHGRELVAELLGLGLRCWVRTVPRGWRAMPQARAAEKRAHVAARKRTGLGPAGAG